MLRVKSKLIFWIVISITAILFLGVSLEVSSLPGFCNAMCHEMHNDHTAWNKSEHANVLCINCHIGPGVVRLMYHKVGSLLHEVPIHFFGDKEHINVDSSLSTEIPSENCMQCHVRPKDKNFRNLVFVHTKHKEFVCAYCHNRIAHPEIKGYKNRATMNFCINCHKKKGKPTNCLFCHTPSIMNKPPTHKSADWVPVSHKSKVDPGCTFCHKREYCLTCHVKIRVKGYGD
jgi:hypothetical protein